MAAKRSKLKAAKVGIAVARHDQRVLDAELAQRRAAPATDSLGLTLKISNAEMLRRLAVNHECTSCSTCRTVAIGALTFAQLAMNIALQGKL